MWLGFYYVDGEVVDECEEEGDERVEGKKEKKELGTCWKGSLA